jgi:hypothetical protein
MLFFICCASITLSVASSCQQKDFRLSDGEKACPRQAEQKRWEKAPSNLC